MAAAEANVGQDFIAPLAATSIFFFCFIADEKVDDEGWHPISFHASFARLLRAVACAS